MKKKPQKAPKVNWKRTGIDLLKKQLESSEENAEAAIEQAWKWEKDNLTYQRENLILELACELNLSEHSKEHALHLECSSALAASAAREEKLRGELERVRAENEKLDTEGTNISNAVARSLDYFTKRNKELYAEIGQLKFDLSHERSHRRTAEADVKHWKDIAETQGEQLVKQQAELSRLQPFNRVLEKFPPAELDLRSAVGLGNTGS